MQARTQQCKGTNVAQLEREKADSTWVEGGGENRSLEKTGVEVAFDGWEGKTPAVESTPAKGMQNCRHMRAATPAGSAACRGGAVQTRADRHVVRLRLQVDSSKAFVLGEVPGGRLVWGLGVWGAVFSMSLPLARALSSRSGG